MQALLTDTLGEKFCQKRVRYGQDSGICGEVQAQKEAIGENLQCLWAGPDVESGRLMDQ